MSWLTPIGFLGLIGLIVLLIIYLIKPNYQTKQISSTFVWKLSLKYRKKKLPISKLRNILLVCSYVIFFSALLGTLQFLPLVQELPEAIKALLFCTFEISGGVSHAAALKEPLQAALLTAAGVGWSGLSVHCQIISICDGYHLSMRTYFAAKLFQALLCTVTLAIVLGISPTLLLVGTPC